LEVLTRSQKAEREKILQKEWISTSSYKGEGIHGNLTGNGSFGLRGG
jgi:hypothetical protein